MTKLKNIMDLGEYNKLSKEDKEKYKKAQQEERMDRIEKRMSKGQWI